MSQALSPCPPPPSPGGPFLPECQTLEYAHREDHFERLERRRATRLPGRNNRRNGDLIASVTRAAEQFGRNRLVSFSFTFPKNLPWSEATSALKRLRKSLKNELRGWVWIADFNRTGACHFHGIAVVDFDAEEGLDRQALGRLRDLEKICRKQTPEQRQERLALQRMWTSNPSLIALQKRIKGKLTGCGFGWKTELSPIRETPEIAAKYLIKRLAATQRGRHVRAMKRRPAEFTRVDLSVFDSGPELPRGAHLFGFVGEFPKVRTTELTAGQVLHREKLAAIQKALGSSSEEMSMVYGSRWKFYFRRVVDELDYSCGTDPFVWRAEAIKRCVSARFPSPRGLRLFRALGLKAA